MIASLTINDITSSMTVHGGVKTADFLRYVEQRLVPMLRQGDVVCWDNIDMHENNNVMAAILYAGASILKLRRYSPDLNPIEAAWSRAKHLIRKYGPQTVGELNRTIGRSLRRTGPSDAVGWIRYCGYSLPLF